jgi:hypothetical protein
MFVSYEFDAGAGPRIDRIELRFDVGGLCAGKPHQWTTTSTAYPRFKSHIELGTTAPDIPAGGCSVEIVEPHVLSWSLEVSPSEVHPGDGSALPVVPDFLPRLKHIQDQRNAADAPRRAAEASRLAKIRALPLIRSGSSQVFVAADRKCGEQFQEALSMDGLEKRKRIAEIVSYGCGSYAASPVHAEVKMETGGYALVVLAEGVNRNLAGWVPLQWVVPSAPEKK